MDPNVYITVMIWIYVIGLLINCVKLIICSFPIKEEESWGQCLVVAIIQLIFLWWITGLEGVVS